MFASITIVIAFGCSATPDSGDHATYRSPSKADAGRAQTEDPYSAPLTPTDAGTGTQRDSSLLPVDGGNAPVTGCPAGRGPAMVRITDDYGSFCVDSTEVTNRQMNAFLASAERPQAPTECSAKKTFGGVPRTEDDRPVTQVDWCDAWMFCAWARKRLCSTRNGTIINDYPPANDPRVSEWYSACSHTSGRAYPYGATYDSSACAGEGAAIGDVGSHPRCEGGYAGIFDMSGNVSEWEDNCNGDDCPARGGDHTSPATILTCALPNTATLTKRTDKSDSIGIRCCAP